MILEELQRQSVWEESSFYTILDNSCGSQLAIDHKISQRSPPSQQSQQFFNIARIQTQTVTNKLQEEKYYKNLSDEKPAVLQKDCCELTILKGNDRHQNYDSVRLTEKQLQKHPKDLKNQKQFFSLIESQPSQYSQNQSDSEYQLQQSGLDSHQENQFNTNKTKSKRKNTNQIPTIKKYSQKSQILTSSLTKQICDKQNYSTRLSLHKKVFKNKYKNKIGVKNKKVAKNRPKNSDRNKQHNTQQYSVFNYIQNYFNE